MFFAQPKERAIHRGGVWVLSLALFVALFGATTYGKDPNVPTSVQTIVDRTYQQFLSQYETATDNDRNTAVLDLRGRLLAMVGLLVANSINELQILANDPKDPLQISFPLDGDQEFTVEPVPAELMEELKPFAKIYSAVQVRAILSAVMSGFKTLQSGGHIPNEGLFEATGREVLPKLLSIQAEVGNLERLSDPGTLGEQAQRQLAERRRARWWSWGQNPFVPFVWLFIKQAAVPLGLAVTVGSFYAYDAHRQTGHASLGSFFVPFAWTGGLSLGAIVLGTCGNILSAKDEMFERLGRFRR